MGKRDQMLLQVKTDMSGGRVDAAARACANLLLTNPRDIEARYLHGRCKAALGRWEDAAAEFSRVLAVSPQYYPALIDVGIARALAGEHRQGLAPLELARRIDARPAELHFGLGLCALGMGDLAAAEESLRAAVSINPGLTDACNNLGVVLDRQGRLDEAIACFQQVVRMQPEYAVAHKNLADAQLRAGQPAAAAAAYRQVVERAPQEASGYADLGMALLSAGAFEEALAPLQQAMALDPTMFDAPTNLGEALRNLGQLDAAARAFEQALSIRRDVAEAHLGLGRIAATQMRVGEAEARLLTAAQLRLSDSRIVTSIARALEDLGLQHRALDLLQRAAELAPTNGDLQEARGEILQRFGRLPEAVEAFERALAFEQNRPQTLLCLGGALESLGSHHAAVTSIQRSLGLRPASAEGYAGLVSCGMRVCDWSLADDALDRLRGLPNGLDALHPFLVLASDLEPQSQSYILRRRGQSLRPPEAMAPAPRYAHDRLRLAFVSPDFREHPVAHALVGVIERMDRERFSAVGVSLAAADDSQIGQRVRSVFDRFVDASASSPSEVARVIREQEIDIAIDLGGHTAGARPAIFASRPAAVQMNYLGFPGTSGADFMDFIIADPIVIPPDDEPLYSERVIRLPNCYLPFDARRAEHDKPALRADLDLPQDAFVFCAFNSGYKITRSVFEVWMELLREVPGSVLWLRSAQQDTLDNLRQAATAQGVAADRLVFAPFVERKEEYIARLRCADIFLDTSPYNAHTTASEVLWAGVPVISCLGSTFAGRVGASMLQAVGLEDLVCRDLAEYRQLALHFAHSRSELDAMRERLRSNRQELALFDTERYTRDFEAALADAWRIGSLGRDDA